MKQVCVGIDLGGTLIKVGLVEDGQVTNRAVLTSESAAGLAPKLPALRELVDRLVSGRTVDSSAGGPSTRSAWPCPGLWIDEPAG